MSGILHFLHGALRTLLGGIVALLVLMSAFLLPFIVVEEEWANPVTAVICGGLLVGSISHGIAMFKLGRYLPFALFAVVPTVALVATMVWMLVFG